MSDKVREEFEEWFIENYCHGCGPVNYGSATTMTAWRAWKASRAALCVQLPAVEFNSENDPWYVQEVTEGAIKDALDSSGVSYK